MGKKYLELSDISAYNKAFSFANYIWDIVIKWDYFKKDTIGKQFVRAADSVSANIAEGFGRYSKKDKIRFYRISLGSLQECKDWINKSCERRLIEKDLLSKISNDLKELEIEIYHLIKYTNEKLKF